MKYSEVKSQSVEALKKELVTLQEKRENLKMKVKLAQVKNPHQLMAVRKDIARIMTFLNEARRAPKQAAK